LSKYVFDLERSARGLRLNRFLHGLIAKESRALFLGNPEQAMQDYGASFFCLEKLARTKGVSNPQMVAAFRGETLEQFLKTRRVPGAR
jgi:gallate dioxygenase